MSLNEVKKRINELELERILNIFHFKELDDWIALMEKRWKKRVKQQNLLSLYKWVKDIYGKFEIHNKKIEALEKRIDKLENLDSK